MVNHIIALLKFHDYVIIPGLGGFISHYESAKRSLSTQTITPPSKRLAFNRSLKENDGLLINQLVAADNLSQAQAKQAIDSFKLSVEESLEQSGAYLFQGIGKLVLDQSRNLQFHPIIQENLLLDSFGLDRVVAQPIQRIKEAHQAEAKETISLKVVEAEEEKVVKIVPQEIVYKPVLFRAAAAIGLLFVVGTVFMSLFNGNVSTDQFSFLPVQQTPQTFEAELAAESDLVSLHSESADFVLYTPTEVIPEIENTAIQTPTVSSTVVNSQSNKNYHIIVGSFLDDVRMNKEITNMKAKGYTVVTLAGPKGYTRVALQFNESASAKHSQLQTIRNSINPDAWMMGN